LPLKYIDEVASAPESWLSLQEYFFRLGLIKYTHGPPISSEVQRVVRADLKPALDNIIQPLQTACLDGFSKEMPECQDWTPVVPFNPLMRVFVRMASLMLVGPELRDEWTDFSFEYLGAMTNATRTVRASYRPYTRWLAQYIDPDVKRLVKARRKAGQILGPAHEARLAQVDAQGGEVSGRQKHKDLHRNHDALQWFTDDYKNRGLKPSPDQIAQNVLNLSVASTSQDGLVALWSLFDLVEHPDSLQEIRDEIVRVQSKHSSWTRQALSELEIMDSFMSETIRIHSFTQSSVNRMVMKPYTFQDGYQLPIGTQVSFPTQQYSHDPDVYADPQSFDPKRYFNKRKQSDGAKYHFASTADSLVWGRGSHACPGRFFVQDALKLIFVHILTRYDFKYPEEGKTSPSPDIPNGIMCTPDITMSVLFKERHV
jgi:cytochrome P450